MDSELLPIFGSLVLLAGIVGLAVKWRLDRREQLRAKAAQDELLAKVIDVADADMPAFIVNFIQRRRAEKIRAEIPDALDMLANSLTAGLTLPQALLRNLDHFSPTVQGEMARVIYDTRLGFSVAEAFENLARRLGLKDVQMISIASRIGVEHGGNLAESYRMLSSLLRDSLAFESELKAMTTEGRMQAIVMTCLPFALLGLLSMINWDLFGLMFRTMIGWSVLGGLCVMLGVAYFWIRKIVDIHV